MKLDRRNILKMFGLSGAAIAAEPATTQDPVVEIVTGPAVPHPVSLTEKSPFPDYDIRDEPLYGCFKVERNLMKERYSVFSFPLGQDWTLAETNMYQPNQLMMPEMFCIKQVGVVFAPDTIPALRSAFINRYVLGLTIGRKSYWTAPLSMAFSVGERSDRLGALPDAGFVTLDVPLILTGGLRFDLDLIGRPIHPCGSLKAWGVFKGLHHVGIC